MCMESVVIGIRLDTKYGNSCLHEAGMSAPDYEEKNHQNGSKKREA